MAWNELIGALANPPPQSYRACLGCLSGINPPLYWYPCCGTDLSPLVFDVRERDGLRIFPLVGSAGSVVLWMNDWDQRLPSLYEALTGQGEYAGRGTLDETLARHDAKLEIVPGSRWATSISVRPELPDDPAYIPLEVFRVVVRNPGASRGVRRPADGDDYIVFYSNADSTVLTRLVFRDFNLALKVGAVIHPGWCEPPNGPINHYSLVPRTLDESYARTGVRPYLLTDNRRELEKAYRYRDTGFVAEKWTGVPVNLLERSQAEAG